MKRSISVPATLVAAVAATVLAGCRPPTQVRRCTDENGNVVDDAACTQRMNYHYGGAYGRGIYPRWVYGGEVKDGRIRGASLTPRSGAQLVTSSGRSISRGGFGSSGRSSGFGGFG